MAAWWRGGVVAWRCGGVAASGGVNSMYWVLRESVCGTSIPLQAAGLELAIGFTVRV